MKTVQLCALVFMMATPAPAQDTPPPGTTSVGLSIVTVYSDGQSIQAFKNVPDPAQEPVAQIYTIMIPYTENGVTKQRTETRERMASPMIQKLVPLDDSAFFISLTGEQLDPAILARSVTRAGKPVLRFPRVPTKQELELIGQLVRDDAVILVSLP